MEAKTRFLDFLDTKQLRMTAQRMAIIDTVFSTNEHFTAEQLLEWSRKRDKSVSRATVYRTLPLLTESDLVREMDFGKEFKFYDPNYADHRIIVILSARIVTRSWNLRATRSPRSKRRSFTNSAFQWPPNNSRSRPPATP